MRQDDLEQISPSPFTGAGYEVTQRLRGRTIVSVSECFYKTVGVIFK